MNNGGGGLTLPLFHRKEIFVDKDNRGECGDKGE